jgi:hypothetical protein
VAFSKGRESALQQAEREGILPLGLLKSVAQLQLEEEIATLQQKEHAPLELKPYLLQINSSLSVIFRGTIDAVIPEGLALSDKESFKNAIRAWPYFLLLNASDKAKRHLFFAATQTVKEAFFDKPDPFLNALVEHFFYAQEHPLLLTPDWIEPILKEDPDTLSRTLVYDPLLTWQLQGRGRIDYEKIVESYHPLVKKLYQEMADAWF